jgi:hypothetical protein
MELLTRAAPRLTSAFCAVEISAGVTSIISTSL